jgi:hypothetical protein
MFQAMFGTRRPCRRARPANARCGLEVQTLEDRAVPSATPTLDLTTSGAIGSINGAIFMQDSPQPTGTGVINSFVRLQTRNGKATVEQGYNTEARPVQFDENTSPQFTRSLHLSEVPSVDIGGTTYREFLLDINQKASQPYLSLDSLQVFTASAPDLVGYGTSTGLGALTPGYDLDAGGAVNWIKLDARLSHGSGSGDMLAYIPDSTFARTAANPDPYVYVYSKFGVNVAGNGGFEEWAAGKSLITPANGSISGTVYVNGVPTPDVTVFFDTNGNGTLDSNEVYVTTDSSGNYTFKNLATGLGSLSTYDVSILSMPDSTGATSQSVSLSGTQTTVTGVNFWIVFPNNSGSGSGSNSGGGSGTTIPAS